MWPFKSKKRKLKEMAFDQTIREKHEVLVDIRHLRSDITKAVDERNKKKLAKAMDDDFKDTVKGG